MCEEQLQVSIRLAQNFIACMDLPTLFIRVEPLPDYWRFPTSSTICVDGGVKDSSDNCEVIAQCVAVNSVEKQSRSCH